ncbi:hypothetical protein FHU38_002277 [Saccharomonospora amisosensis]|uniref:Uncharacterized protein n=1 Tax=Saccharomonospora amisosensis TaxID=1128677 RepID=A0A7X5ZQK3_9PSEU|nr:hypothetical protein [Saccharomonospora amisosensis]NIJ11933.1 hypothetical protein [Saccharomonospora amisosensis]
MPERLGTVYYVTELRQLRGGYATPPATQSALASENSPRYGQGATHFTVPASRRDRQGP